MGLIAKLVERRQQGSLANPSPALREALGVVPTGTGAHVNPETAMTLTTVYACVRLKAETIASLPWHLYRREGRAGAGAPRGREPATGHPVYRLLHDRPNPEMTAFEFRECLVGHLETWGNAFAEIELDQGAYPRALWPLRPDRMEVERILERQERRVRYTYMLPSGRRFVFPTDRVLHLRQNTPDGLIGVSPISAQRETIGLALALDQYAGRFFGNDSRPGGVLEVQGRLSQDAANRLKTQWETHHQGFTRAHRVAVLEEGVSWKAVGLPPADSQFLESRKFQKSEIASIFRVPPHMIGDVERSTSWGSGIEAQSIGFVQHTLGPLLKLIEQRADQSLLMGEGEADRYYSELAVDGLLRGDSRSRAQLLQTMRQNGILNADEWRALENLNALPDGQGQLYLAPANLVPLEQLAAPPEPPAERPPATLTAGTNGTASGSPPAPAPRLAGSREREYRCRACGHVLFRSPDERGRITTICPARQCREYQTVLVGGPLLDA